MESKKIAAEKAVEYVTDGMVVGLGTGSTAYWAIQSLGKKVSEGLRISAIATSLQSERLAQELNIPLVSFADVDHIDVTIDGADEVDKNMNLIKGGGGALLREKIVAFHSKTFLVIIDESKAVEKLGKFPLPIEIVPFGVEATLRRIQELGGFATLRTADKNLYVTDNGNFIADCSFYPIEDPALLDENLHKIPGIVETGIFLHQMVSSIIIGSEAGSVTELS